METRRLIDAAKLAGLLDIKTTTVRMWTRTTDIPRIRCGRLVRYDFDEVLAWLRKRRGSLSAAGSHAA